MSLIADALQKAKSSPSAPAPSPARSPRPVWIYLTVGFSGLVLILVTRSLIHPPPSSGPPSAANHPPASASAPLGLNLLRAADSHWQLNGVVRGGEGRSLALINGDLVEEGGTVHGAKVIRVASDEVDLETDGKIQTLKLR